MHTFHHTCIGFSHLASGKPCQDASFAGTIGDLHLAIVSDGHGGHPHPRSAIGAQFAIIAAKTVIDNNPLTSWQDPSLRPVLLHELVRSWRELVMEHHDHIRSYDDTDTIHVFDKKEREDRQDIYALYGCTLIVACIHTYGWFAFQIGDGKCVIVNSMQKENAQLTSEPIPDDARCFLNMTTSLCDLNAETEFRFCGGDNDSVPSAIFIGTDGIDTSWGTKELLHDFYLEILKHCSSRETIMREIEDVLPKLSEKGSHDDMSIAALVQEETLPKLIPAIFQYQINECQCHKRKQETRLCECEEAIKKKQTELVGHTEDEFLQRDLSNLQNHLCQLEQLLARTTSRLNRLQHDFATYLSSQ